MFPKQKPFRVQLSVTFPQPYRAKDTPVSGQSIFEFIRWLIPYTHTYQHIRKTPLKLNIKSFVSGEGEFSTRRHERDTVYFKPLSRR